MNARFVARLDVPLSTGRHRRGTAYPIARDLLITALHVVNGDGIDGTADMRITWPALDDPDSPGKCLQRELGRENIIYPGDESNPGCDVALIQCPLLPEMNDSPLLLSPGQSPPETWESKGYPEVCRTRLDLDGLCSVSGRYETSGTGCIIELNTNTDTQDTSGWAGLSGAPVFSGNWLTGIISNTNPGIRNQLEAVFLPYLISHDQDFRQHLGIRLHADFSGAIDALKQGEAGKTACAALAAQLQCSPEPEELVRVLKDLQPLGRLLDVIHNAQHHLGQQEGANTVLKDVLFFMLPKLFDFSCCDKIRQSQGNSKVALVSIPYAMAVSAEMLMAGVDGRKADLQLVSIGGQEATEQEIRIASFRLSPETGGSIQEQVENMVRDLLDSTGGQSGLPFMEIADDFYRRVVPSRPTGSLCEYPEAISLVHHYSKRAVSQGKSYYWLLVLPSEEEYRQRYRELVQRFRDMLPHITVLALDGDRLAMHERRSYYDALLDVLSV